MNYHCTISTELLGDLLLIANESHLLGVQFADVKAHTPTGSVPDPDQPILRAASKQLDEFLAGRRKQFSIPLHFEGTPFQHAVWQRIAAIPFGESITYSDLAAAIRAPKATRAAGSATGKNPIAVIIPCHRILASGGALGGFGGGLARKTRLLELEGIRIGHARAKRAAIAGAS